MSDIEERYTFTWVGKRKAKRAAYDRDVKENFTLRPCKEESLNWDTTQNLYIEGDNLKVLQILLESYLHKVKMIYIDPPYNTGNDFIYRDNFSMDAENLAAQINLFDEDGNKNFKLNPNSNPRFHSDWCSMIYSRLLVARNFLADDGVIFISIDDNEQANLRKICDEVFGERNFCAMLTRRSMHTVRNSSKDFNKNSDFVLVYARNKDIFRIREKVDKSNAYKFNDGDGRGFYKLDPIYARNYAKPYKFTFQNGIVWEAPEGSFPRYSQETLAQMEKDNRLNFDGKFPRAKRYLDEVQEGQPPDTILKEEKVGFNSDGTKLLAEVLGNDKVFSQPKPIQFIKYLINILPDNEESIIMDFFSGSATTAHAVLQLNAEDGGRRKFIMVQLPEACNEKSEAYKAGYKNICEIGKERIRRAGAKIKNDAPLTTLDLDVGFRVFKLDTTNMRDVKISPFEFTKEKLLDLLENIKPDRTALDLLFEHLLKWGVEISKPYAEEKLDGYTIHNYNDGDFIACFDKNVTRRVFEYIAKKKPRRAVFRDHCFKDVSDKINATEFFKYYAPNTRLKVI